MKIKITITMDEQKANWFLSALETLMDGWLEEEGSEKYRFFRRIRKTIERHLTKRAPDARKSALKKVSSNKKGSAKPARG